MSLSVHERRIDEKDDGHIKRFAGLQCEIREAETLQLVEIGPGQIRLDIISRLRGHGFRRIICDLVENRCGLTDLQSRHLRFRLECPR